MSTESTPSTFTPEAFERELQLDSASPLASLRIGPAQATALLEQVLRWREMPPVLETGHPGLTNDTRGLAGLVILGAPPGTGKSTLCSYWAAQALKAGRSVLYLACEESRVAVFERVVKALGPWGMEHLLKPPGLSFYLTDVKAEFGLDDPAGFAALCARLPLGSRGEGAVVLVDSLHVASTVLPTGDTISRVSRIVDALRAGANVPTVASLLATAHVSRESIKESRPAMQALRDSSTIEHAADQILIGLSLLRQGNRPVTPADLLTHKPKSPGRSAADPIERLRLQLAQLPPIPSYYPEALRNHYDADYAVLRLWLKKNRFFGPKNHHYDFLVSGLRCHLLPLESELLAGSKAFYFGEKPLDE